MNTIEIILHVAPPCHVSRLLELLTCTHKVFGDCFFFVVVRLLCSLIPFRFYCAKQDKHTHAHTSSEYFCTFGALPIQFGSASLSLGCSWILYIWRGAIRAIRQYIVVRVWLFQDSTSVQHPVRSTESHFILFSFVR